MGYLNVYLRLVLAQGGRLFESLPQQRVDTVVNAMNHVEEGRVALRLLFFRHRLDSLKAIVVLV